MASHEKIPHVNSYGNAIILPLISCPRDPIFEKNIVNLEIQSLSNLLYSNNQHSHTTISILQYIPSFRIPRKFALCFIKLY